MGDVELITSEEDFRALEPDWQQLVDDSPDVPFFLTWEWISTWWKHLGREWEPWVLVARGKQRSLVGIAPWAIRQRAVGPLQLRSLEFLGRIELPIWRDALDGENLDIIARAAARDDVCSTFVQHLRTRQDEWDLIDFGWLASNSRLRHSLKRTNMLWTEWIEPCAWTCLPQNWEAYEQTILEKSERKQIRRDSRRLVRHYPEQVDYRLITKQDQIASAMDNLIRMNRDRWAEVGLPTGFEFEELVRFHIEFVETAFDRGWVRFFELRVGDEVLASICTLLHQGRFHEFQTGFNPTWRKYGPGKVLHGYTIQHAIREGAREYDMLHGGLDVKRSWTRTVRHDVRMMLSNNWKGTFFIAARVGKEKAKAILRRVIPKQTRKRIRQFIDRNDG